MAEGRAWKEDLERGSAAQRRQAAKLPAKEWLASTFVLQTRFLPDLQRACAGGWGFANAECTCAAVPHIICVYVRRVFVCFANTFVRLTHLLPDQHRTCAVKLVPDG